MEFFAIRLKRYPHLYVGKSNSSYAVMADSKIDYWKKERPSDSIDRILQTDAHWFKSEKHAKIWTDRTTLKRFLSYCGEKEKGRLFSEYEVVCNGKVIDIAHI